MPRLGQGQVISVVYKSLEKLNLRELTKIMGDLGLPTDEVEEAKDAIAALKMNSVS